MKLMSSLQLKYFVFYCNIFCIQGILAYQWTNEKVLLYPQHFSLPRRTLVNAPNDGLSKTASNFSLY